MATGVEVHKREVDEIEMDESKKMKLEETVIRIPSPQKLNGVRDPSPARLSNGASSPTNASIFKDVSSVHNASPQPASPLKMEVPSQQSPRKMDSGVSSPSRMETGHSSPVRETRLPSPSNAIREAHPNRVSVIANVSTIEVAPMEEVVQERAKSPMRASSPQTRAPSPPKNEASLPRVSSPQRIEVCASPVRSRSPARAVKSPMRAEPASPFRTGKSPVRDEPAAPIIATELNVEQPSGDLPSALPSAVASEFTDVVSGAAEGYIAADETLVKAQLKHCLNVVKILKRSKNAHWFSQPVDPVALNIPHYPTIVKNPMDLGTIEKKLNENVYTDYQQVVDDVNLMVDNCILFNGKEAAISGWAIDLQKMMKKHMQKLPLSLDQKPKKRNSEKLSTHVDTVRPRRDVHAPPREYNAVTSPSRRSKKHTPEYKFAYAVHRELVGKKHYLINWPFLAPVDWKALNIPTYPEIIKHPMDLSTVKKKLDYDEYEALDDIENDFRLIFNNCFTFNNPMDDVYLCGKKLEQVFYEKWSEKNKFLSQYGVAKKSRPSSGMYDDSSDESSDDEMNQQQINMLQQNLMMMNSQLAMLMENRKKKKKKRKSLPNPALAAVPGAKKSVSKRKRSSVGGSAIGKKMKKDYISDDEEIKGMQYEAIPELSIEQKMYVSQNIETLNPEQLQRVLALIKEGMPNVAEDGSDEIELDINSMDKRTLFRLHSYIRTCKAAGLKTGDVRKYPTSSSGSSSSGSESSDSGSD